MATECYATRATIHNERRMASSPRSCHYMLSAVRQTMRNGESYNLSPGPGRRAARPWVQSVRLRLNREGSYAAAEASIFRQTASAHRPTQPWSLHAVAVFACSSPRRRELLTPDRFRRPCSSPAIDESLSNERPPPMSSAWRRGKAAANGWRWEGRGEDGECPSGYPVVIP